MEQEPPVGPDGLPIFKTITVHNGIPEPDGKVEVTPHGGRIHFVNQDDVEYRLRFGDDEEVTDWDIDVLLPPHGRITIPIKKDDEFLYYVIPMNYSKVESGRGGGPIKN